MASPTSHGPCIPYINLWRWFLVRVDNPPRLPLATACHRLHVAHPPRVAQRGLEAVEGPLGAKQLLPGLAQLDLPSGQAGQAPASQLVLAGFGGAPLTSERGGVCVCGKGGGVGVGGGQWGVGVGEMFVDEASPNFCARQWSKPELGSEECLPIRWGGTKNRWSVPLVELKLMDL